MKLTKFATQVDIGILKDLRDYAKAQGKSISRLVSEALAEYLKKVRVRPAFRNGMEDVISENEELLKRLAK